MNNYLKPLKDPLMEEFGKDFFSIVPGIEQAGNVPVLHADSISEEEFKKEWVDNNRPCVIKNAVSNWAAVEKWKSEEYWLSKCEDFEVSAYPHFNHNDMDKQELIDGEEMTFHNAINRLFEGKDEVFSIPGEEITSDNRFSKILEDIGEFEFLKKSNNPRAYERRRFFIYRRAATAWHYHQTDETLMCQINGTKRVALLSPDIPQAKEVTTFLQKEKHLDGENLNKQLDLKPFIVDVEEGDALYIPPYWHHGVVPSDGEVGFTMAFCWSSPLHKAGDLSNYFVRKLYKQAAWPINAFTPAIPFLGLYAGASYLSRKLTGKKRS